MNFRLTAILFAVIFVVGVVLLIFTFTGDEKPSGDILLEELTGVKLEDVDSVEIERTSGGSIKLTLLDREANRWNITEPYTARADGAAIKDLVGSLLRAKPTAYGELSSNPAVHGLQPAGIRVTLRAGERAASINLGEVTSGGRGVVFVTTSARPDRPMAAPRDALAPLLRDSGQSGKAVDLAKWVNDYRARSVFPVNPRGLGDDISALTLTHGKNNLALERGGSTGWQFTTPAGWGGADPFGDVAAAPGTFTGVNKLISTLTNIQALASDDFISEPKPEDLERYGVKDDSPGVIRVEMKTKEGESATAFIGKKDAAAPATPPTPGMPESGKWWVRVVGQPGVIRANATELGGLAAVIDNPDPLRDRTLVAVNRLNVDGIDLAGGATRLRKSDDFGNPWKLYGKPEYGDPQPATGVEEVINLLTERRIIKAFPKPDPANFAAAELKGAVRIWENGFEEPKEEKDENKEEKKDEKKPDPKVEPKEKGKPIILEFGKKEADGTIHVRRTLADGTQAYFLLPEKVKLPTTAEPVDVLAAANRSRLEMLDKSLKGFAATVANKLTVAGTVNFELEKDAKPDSSTGGLLWRFAKPEEKKGQIADATVVEDVLSALANTRMATRLVDESGDAAKLAGYGLGPVPEKKEMKGDPPTPRLRVIVGIKDNATPVVYEFGDPLPGDPTLVYAKQPGRSVVFALPKVLVDKFSADLRDKSIFRFDPAAVTAVEFKGWSKIGFVVDLQFGKNKDGVWVVTKAPGENYNLDPAKLDAFLRLLSSTRVKAFLPGDRTREQGLFDDGKADQKDNLSITVRVKDDPGIHLILGNATDADASYFGWTSRVKPPAVFTLDAAVFKKYREGPGAFAR